MREQVRVQVTEDEYHMLSRLLPVTNPFWQKLHVAFNQSEKEAELDAAYIAAVEKTDELQVDSDTMVSYSDDGAWVMTWTFVSDSAAGVQVCAGCEVPFVETRLEQTEFGAFCSACLQRHKEYVAASERREA